MPRQARLDTPGTLHHMMMRGIERKRIFRKDEDRKDFVSRLRNLSQETGTRLLAWSLLIPMAEIGRHVGVCTSAIANAIRKAEMANKK